MPDVSPSPLSVASPIDRFRFFLVPDTCRSVSPGSILLSTVASSSNAFVRSNRLCFSRCLLRSVFLVTSSPPPSSSSLLILICAESLLMCVNVSPSAVTFDLSNMCRIGCTIRALLLLSLMRSTDYVIGGGSANVVVTGGQPSQQRCNERSGVPLQAKSKARAHHGETRRARIAEAFGVLSMHVPSVFWSASWRLFNGTHNVSYLGKLHLKEASYICPSMKVTSFVITSLCVYIFSP